MASQRVHTFFAAGAMPVGIAIGVALLGASPASAETAALINDPALRATVIYQLELDGTRTSNGDLISRSEMESLTSLQLIPSSSTLFPGQAKTIQSLDGISQAKNLKEVDFSSQVLPNMQETELGNDTSLAPLCGLPKLETLTLWGAGVDNAQLETVGCLSSLKRLNIGGGGGGPISDLSPLKFLGNLESLDISGNSIKDLSPISGLVNLSELRSGGYSFSNMDPVGNPISDLSPLRKLVQLTVLDLANSAIDTEQGDGIRDLKPLSGLVELTSLNLSNGSISDIAPLSSLKKLVDLNLGSCPSWRGDIQTIASNRISDLSPLKGLPLDLDTFSASCQWLGSTSGIEVRGIDGKLIPVSTNANGLLSWPADLDASSFWESSFSGAFSELNPFSDVTRSQPFFDDISWMLESGVTTGYTDGTYRPLGNVTRDAMAAFLYRASGSPEFTEPKVSPFKDVTKTQPFYKEITWLASEGISTGWIQSDGSKLYRPTDKITRDAMSAFLYRAAGSPTFMPPSKASFKDVPRSQPFFREVEWMKARGVSTGWGDGTYRPVDYITRDAMAAFLHRASEMIAE